VANLISGVCGLHLEPICPETGEQVSRKVILIETGLSRGKAFSGRKLKKDSLQGVYD